MGRAIVSDLRKDYAVIGTVNRRPMSKELTDSENVSAIQADFSEPDWDQRVAEALKGRALYGVVHAAWPGAPNGGLLGASEFVVDQQLSFGTTQMIRLSRLIFANAAKDGGRVVTLGSSLGSQKPKINFAPYSLGKMAMEHTVRLLAPELARKNITINAVCPFPAAVGMHRYANDVQRMKDSALVPMGRLCTPEDVVGMVRFLSGQSITLSGAQL
jgi:NAD(P)-dependent dehydrogenase (short-subunit alcohol dehydrogenase family)